MSFEVIEKGTIDNFLKELAKEYRHLVGKTMPAEIILIGGASVVINYGFRDMTTDIDAVIQASGFMKDAINNVGERLNLPYDWLNDDFKKTVSYSPFLSEVSVYYKTFANVLTVRTVSAEYLIAMKLKSGRMYKKDLSDIVGIIAQHKEEHRDISKELIISAYEKLYDSWDNAPKESKIFLDSIITDYNSRNYNELYLSVRKTEIQAKNLLSEFENDYPDVLSDDNINDILSRLKK